LSPKAVAWYCGWTSRLDRARSAGVWPAVLQRSNRVATLTSTIEALSTIETAATCRTPSSLVPGSRNQKESVKPSPSASARVRPTTFRSVPTTNSSRFGPRSFRRMKFGSGPRAVSPSTAAKWSAGGPNQSVRRERKSPTPL